MSWGGKSDKMRSLSSILSLVPKEFFTKLNKTGAQILHSINHMYNFGVKTLGV